MSVEFLIFGGWGSVVAVTDIPGICTELYQVSVLIVNKFAHHKDLLIIHLILGFLFFRISQSRERNLEWFD